MWQAAKEAADEEVDEEKKRMRPDKQPFLIIKLF